MSEEPMRLRMGHCGHWLPADHPPAGVTDDMHGQLVHLCDDCLEKVRAHQRPRVETKDVRPEATAVRPDPGLRAAEYEAGRRAALDNRPRALPPELTGQHARSAGPRAWFRGFDEAKSAEAS